MNNLKERVVVITGAGSGIGASLARQAAEQGARLALCDVNDAGLVDTKTACGNADVLTEHVDVSDRAAMNAFRDHVIERFGQPDRGPLAYPPSGNLLRPNVNDTAQERASGQHNGAGMNL